MVMRESFKRKIIESIEKNTELYGDDFKFQDNKVETGVNFDIEYFYNSKFYFKLELLLKEVEVEKEGMFGKINDKTKQYTYNCSMSPGILFDELDDVAYSENDFWKIFQDWTIRLWEDIQATSLFNKIERINREFEQYKEKLDNDSEDYFTYDEAQIIIDRLSEIEKKLQEHIENDEEENSEINKMESDIDLLKDEVYSMSKKNWFKKYYVRFSKWILNPSNQKLLIDSATNIKKLISKDNIE